MPADLQAETTDGPAAARPLQHGQPAGQRATGDRVSGRVPRARPGSRPRSLAADDERPNLVATLDGERATGPTLCYLGHVDTVLADPSEWTHDPWSGDVADGFLWGRGALDMKSQVAAEAVARRRAGPRRLAPEARRAEARVRLRRGDRRRRRRALADREPSRQGPLRHAAQRGRRRACSSSTAGAATACAAREKGIFRFKLTARGAAGHASLPRTGDNALLKLGPVLERLATHRALVRHHRGAGGAAARARRGSRRPARPLAADRARPTPALLILLEPMLGVTLTPTMVHASDKINVIPSRAYVKVDCRVPAGPRRGRRADAHQRRCWASRPTGSSSSSPRPSPATARRSQTRADVDDRRLGQAQRPGRRDRAGDPARVLRFDAGSAPRSPTAWPTASSRTGT